MWNTLIRSLCSHWLLHQGHWNHWARLLNFVLLHLDCQWTSYTYFYFVACLNVDSLPPYATNLPLCSWSMSSAASMSSAYLSNVVAITSPCHRHLHRPLPSSSSLSIPCLSAISTFFSVCDLNFTSVSKFFFSYSSSKCTVEVPMWWLFVADSVLSLCLVFFSHSHQLSFLRVHSQLSEILDWGEGRGGYCALPKGHSQESVVQ